MIGPGEVSRYDVNWSDTAGWGRSAGKGLGGADGVSRPALTRGGGTRIVEGSRSEKKWQEEGWRVGLSGQIWLERVWVGKSAR